VEVPTKQRVEVPVRVSFTHQPSPVGLRLVSHRQWHFVKQITRFGIAGVVNTLLDLVLLNLLLWLFPTRNAVLILIFNSIAYTLGAINSFFLNKYWTFRRWQRPTWGEGVRFVLTTCVGILCSNIILGLASTALQPMLHNTLLLTNIAKVAAIAGTAIISYVGMYLWVFVRETK
jgi:putative flippase GtrA